MKLTPKQQRDLETITYFIPEGFKSIPITDKDILDFLAYSERGQFKERGAKSFLKQYKDCDGFDALNIGKRWRGIHIHMWEDAIDDVPYTSLVKDLPLPVIEFMKKEMFKGKDKDIIEECYRQNQVSFTSYYAI